jgi:ribosome-associated toxin RatA of RatAB toxin-antitoxin module
MGPWVTATLVAVLGAPANLVAVSRATDGHGTEIHIEGTVEAPAWAVETVLRDIGRYPEWFPSMRAAQPISSGVYDAVFSLPWPLHTVYERIQFRRVVVPRAVIIQWRQVSGDFVRDEGRWTLTALDANRTAVRYDAVVQFRHWVPTWLIRHAERRAAPRILVSIQERAQLLTRSARR